jgi:hypothetical protein
MPNEAPVISAVFVDEDMRCEMKSKSQRGSRPMGR